MRSVLIVDDEEVIRESIAGMLRRRYPDQLELAQAENGKRALEYVCSHPVSLVIADIKMPVLSGLDMLERLTELAYMGEVIFISGFDDYALVRRAMKLGAADYLLKPIMEADFYTQIDGFLLREQHRLPKTQEKLTVQRRAYRQQYALERLLTGGAEREVLEENGLQAEQPCILCVLDTAAGVLPSAQLADEWRAQLAPLVTDGCVLLQGEWNKQRMVLFCFHQRAQERAFRAYQQWSFGEHATMVFSKPYPLCKVGEAFKDCQELLRQSFYDDIAKDGEACYPYSALMAGMVSALCALEEERWIALLEGLLALACAQKPPVESLRQLLCSMIYAAIQQNSVFVRLIAIHELTQDDALRCIQGSMGVSALKKELERIGKLLISEAREQSYGRNEQHIQRAKRYIAEHYREELSLAAVANHIGIHPNYFSNLFTKQCGVSYSHYLRGVRIEAACLRMRESDCKLYEIAEEVGYHDQVQFNRAFREEKGCAPSAYQKKR